VIVTKEFRAMGCQIAVQLDADAAATRLLENVPVWFEEWEQSLSRFRPDSELTHVNLTAGIRQPVSETFWKVLNLSLEMERSTGGLVTPAVLNALELAGYEFSFEPGQKMERDNRHGQFSPAPDISELEIYPETKEILLPPGLRLDFGGTAKGWAANETMLRLSDKGPVMVNAGGDICVSAPQLNGLPWKVGIIDPLQPKLDLVQLAIPAGGVATSGKDFRNWLQNGVLRHHIIDPRTGEPAITDILTCTAYATTVMEAEAAAKALFISGSEDENSWLLNHPRTAALLVMDDGSLRSTQTMQKLFWRENDTTNRSN
jgi:FAD:protein FMN transferase